jgi:hypothetical protein
MIEILEIGLLIIQLLYPLLVRLSGLPCGALVSARIRRLARLFGLLFGLLVRAFEEYPSFGEC